MLSPRTKYRPTATATTSVARVLLLLASMIVVAPTASAQPPTISDQPIFAPSPFTSAAPPSGSAPYVSATPNGSTSFISPAPIGSPIRPMVPAPCADGVLGGIPFQDFTVQKPCNSFPDCPFPVLSWRQGPCAGDRGCGAMDLPAHAVRKAIWYTSDDLVALRRDPRQRVAFAQRGLFGLGPTALSSQDFDYPLDAGGQFLLGRRFTDRLSFEASYLGSFEWSDNIFVRNHDPNLLGNTGLLSSPFTGFGLPPVQGLDFNTFVGANTTANLQNVELNFRYRPEFVPYGPFDVSFLYGLRYMHIDETLGYRSESNLPAGGSINTVNVATDNDLIGAQFGLTGHTLIYPSFWIDTDLKGAIYNNHARQRTVYQNTTNGNLTSFANSDGRDDTSFSGDLRVIGNYQLLERLTLRMGYQVTWVTSAATAVGNFQTNIDTLRLGPADIRTGDTITYHGPVLGLTYVR